jgi:hypothetical protein
MTTRPIYVPAAGTNPVPGQEIGQKVNTDKYWEQKRNEIRAMREAVAEEKALEALQNPQVMEPPISMKGSINLGNIDFQEQARTAAAALEKRAAMAEENAQKLAEENSKLKNDLLANTINAMQTNLGGQIAKLQSDLAGNRGSSKSIGEQLKEIIDSANMLGYIKPEAQKAAPVVQNATDAALNLEMLRLQLQDKATERQFAWQMERDRRQWNLDLKKLDQANKISMAEVSRQRDRDQILPSFLPMLGETISKGLMSSRAGAPVTNRPANPVQRQPARPAPIKGAEGFSSSDDIETEDPDSSPNPKIQAGIGEAGTTPCRNCGQTIAIGPTATKAVCAACGMEAEIVRVGAPDGR